MRLTNKNILIVSPESWSHLFVSKHHYARHLALRGNRVWFMNPPGKIEKSSLTDIPSLTVLDYKGFPMGLRFYPGCLKRWFTLRTFKRLQKQAGTRFDVIWSFDNSVFFQLDSLPSHVLKISHIVDLNQNFETAIAAKSSNLCLGVIPEIVERLSRYNDNSYLITHGVEINLTSEAFNLPGNARTKALYFGNLNMPHLNWDLISRAAEIHNEVDFIFIGRQTNLHSHGVTNCHYLPSVPYSDLMKYMNASDILLLFYTAEYDRKFASPHKLLEYLSSGKPVVASFTKEYEGKELLYMSKKDNEWLSTFDYVINHLEECTSEELIAKRKTYALEHTYDKQIDRIEKILASLPA